LARKGVETLLPRGFLLLVAALIHFGQPLIPIGEFGLGDAEAMVTSALSIGSRWLFWLAAGLFGLRLLDVLLWTGVRRDGGRGHNIGSLLLPLLVTVMAGLLRYGVLELPLDAAGLIDGDGLLQASIRVGATAAFWAAAGLTAVRLLDLVVWRGFTRQDGSIAVPRLVVSMLRFVLWGLAVVGAATHLNGEPPVAILTTSGVSLAVVGLALREILSDVASGVVFSFDKPMVIGDEISFRGKPSALVEDITWRAARLRGFDGTLMVIPNSLLANSDFINYGAEDQRTRRTIDIRLPYDASAEQVKPLLLAAVRQVAQARGRQIEAAVLTGEFDPDGVIWQIRVWVLNGEAVGTVSDIRAAALRQLRLAGIEPARRRQDMVYVHAATGRQGPQERLVELLAELPIFSALDPEDIAQLAEAGSRVRAMPGGPPLVAQGDRDDSMFVILSGEVGVDIDLPTGGTKRVAHLVPGAVFGEMSLLTGEPRSATVVAISNSALFRLDKAALAPLFERHPHLPRQLGEIMAQRQLANLAAQNQDEPPPRETLVSDIARRIRSFFRLEVRTVETAS
jgi:small-conductance mechanosensitive channel/CRP-like cAMP-binding protein